MSEQEKELRIEGVVRAGRYASPLLIECSDGMNWVIANAENCLFAAFADRRVVASGNYFKPHLTNGPCYVIESPKLKHFSVSTIRLFELSPDAELVTVGRAYALCGRFERGASDAGETVLSFVTAAGDTLVVANDPAGATVG